MRVGLVYSSPRSTGVGRVALEVAERLSGDPDYRVDPIYLNYSDRTIELRNNAERRVLARMRRLPEYKYLFYFRAQRQMPPYDLYHLATQNLSFISHRPKIVTCHDIIPLVLPENPAHYLFSKVIYSGIRDADWIITVSEATKRDVIAHFEVSPRRVRVIHSGVDQETFNCNIGFRSLFEAYPLSRQHRYILHVSSERPHKNVEGLLRAFSLLKRKPEMGDVKLLKGGEAASKRHRKRTMGVVKELGLQGDILFLGHISDRILAQFYRLAKLFVLPSLYEGFGLPLLEAMACGTPVVTSNTSSMPEVVDNAGVVLCPDDVEGLAQAISALLTENHLYEDLVERGLRRAAMFTWEQTAQETRELYEEFAP